MNITLWNTHEDADNWIVGEVCKNALAFRDSIHYMVLESSTSIHFYKILRHLHNIQPENNFEEMDYCIGIVETGSRIRLCPFNSLPTLLENERIRRQFAYFPQFGSFPLEVVGSASGAIKVQTNAKTLSRLCDIWLSHGDSRIVNKTPFMVSTPLQEFLKANNSRVSSILFYDLYRRLLRVANSEFIVRCEKEKPQYCNNCKREQCACLGEKTLVSEHCPYYAELWLEMLKNENKI